MVLLNPNQPRDVERALIKRLRALKLPDRFVKQLDEAEHLIAENQLRLLKAAKGNVGGSHRPCEAAG